MKQRELLREELTHIMVAFWIIIFILRGTQLWAFINGVAPAVFIDGFHIHHFIFGVILIVAGWYAHLSTRQSLSLSLLGIGLALFFDESMYWTGLHADYWSVFNYVGVVAFSFALLLYRDSRPSRIVRRNHNSVPACKHTNPECPDISVVIPAYNEECFLPATLDSLARQNFRNFEILVVNNGSTDTTASLAQAYGVRVVDEPRRGVGFARQAGVNAARGSIIVMTDADTTFQPEWLSKIAIQFQRDAELVAIGGLFRLSTGPWTAKIFFPWLLYPIWLMDRLIMGGWTLIGANTAARKNALEAIGGFRTHLTLGEDRDISQRLSAVGKVRFLPQLLVTTSGRRYRNGFLAGAAAYIPNWFAIAFLHKEHFTKLTPIRTEAPSRVHQITPIMTAACALFLLFAIQHAHARNFAVSGTEAPRIVSLRQMTHIFIEQREQGFAPRLQKIKWRTRNIQKKSS